MNINPNKAHEANLLNFRLQEPIASRHFPGALPVLEISFPNRTAENENNDLIRPEAGLNPGVCPRLVDYQTAGFSFDRPEISNFVREL